MSGYTINPVKATAMKYDGNPLIGLQDMSDTCFDIIGAFTGTYDAFAISPELSAQCENYINMKKHELLGVDSCDHQVPYRPPMWQQIPAYVPELIKKGMDKDSALKKSIQLCINQVPILKEECIEQNKVYYNALEKAKPVEKYTSNEKQQNSTPLPANLSLPKSVKQHPWAFTGITLFLIGIIIALLYVKFFGPVKNK